MLRAVVSHGFLAIGSYVMCSTSLLLLNQLTLKFFPLPALVTMVQLIFCAAVVAVLKAAGKVEVDDFQRDKVPPYLLYMLVYSAGVFADLKTLSGSNVDTLLMFRSTTPLLVCGLEWGWLGNSLPTWQSGLALVGVHCTFWLVFSMDQNNAE
eukprot:GGOE01002976.1.p2 GENE.GGOE01002976.1~~GGOE01002976.1.p2  ORF type:complete len:152 (+),score=37.53 GGOE01002976.1:44-499(+)